MKTTLYLLCNVNFCAALDIGYYLDNLDNYDIVKCSAWNASYQEPFFTFNGSSIILNKISIARDILYNLIYVNEYCLNLSNQNKF